MKYPVLIVAFKEPQHGYWDFGAKSGGVFTTEINGRSAKYGKDHETNANIRWGCFELNFWFTAGSGRTWKEAASIAKRKLERMLSVPAVVKIGWETVQEL